MSARPVIGIICCARRVGEETAQAVMERYLQAVAIHSDCAALLVPARSDLMDAREVAGRIDGLLLTGSPSNVEPDRYGDGSRGEGPFDHNRDEMSLAMIAAMIGRARPVFGVCRGFQEINVSFGGTLARDLGEPAWHLPHHAPKDASFDEMFSHEHDVTLASGGVLARSLGRTQLRVNSVHYQGVDRLGQGLTVEARAPDGIIEAFSAAPDGAPVLGVQWHPEWHADRDSASIGFFALLGRALRGDTELWTDRGLAA